MGKTRSVEIVQERIVEIEDQIKHAKAGLKQLYAFTLEDAHLDPDSDMYEPGDEEAPFFSEAYLYNLLGKEDARTVLAYLHRVEEWLGMYDGQDAPWALEEARKREERTRR